MTLALLLTAATGAWAEDSESITTTLPEAKTGSVEFTGTHFKITGQRADGDGMNLGSSTKRTITISALNGEIITKVEMTIGFKFYSWEWEVLSTKGNVSGNYTTGYNLTLTDVDVSEVTLSASNTTTGYLQFNKFKIFYVPAGTMVLNSDKTTATMTMPAFDVTAEYELVRDMSVQMTAQVGDGTQEQPRYRVKKDGNKFIPADMEMAAVPALFTVNDAIEQKALTQTQDYIVQIYAIDAEGQPTGQPMTFATFTFEPGIYAVKAVAADGSDYDGETALSNTFQLFQGYEVTVPAGEYATFYKDEKLYVEDEDAVLYTIANVTATEAQLSDAIKVAPAETPLLVYNKSEQDKTFLLIPTTDNTPDNVTAATQFVGTLEATTIPASATGADNYALNGYAFVWVKNEIAVGANKCWLHIASQPAAARAMTRSIVGGNGTTGIDAIENVTIDNEGWYDLQGRKLQAKPNRGGIYIHNGRKVVVH